MRATRHELRGSTSDVIVCVLVHITGTRHTRTNATRLRLWQPLALSGMSNIILLCCWSLVVGDEARVPGVVERPGNIGVGVRVSQVRVNRHPQFALRADGVGLGDHVAWVVVLKA